MSFTKLNTKASKILLSVFIALAMVILALGNVFFTSSNTKGNGTIEITPASTAPNVSGLTKTTTNGTFMEKYGSPYATDANTRTRAWSNWNLTRNDFNALSNTISWTVEGTEYSAVINSDNNVTLGSDVFHVNWDDSVVVCGSNVVPVSEDEFTIGDVTYTINRASSVGSLTSIPADSDPFFVYYNTSSTATKQSSGQRVVNDLNSLLVADKTDVTTRVKSAVTEFLVQLGHAKNYVTFGDESEQIYDNNIITLDTVEYTFDFANNLVTWNDEGAQSANIVDNKVTLNSVEYTINAWKNDLQEKYGGLIAANFTAYNSYAGFLTLVTLNNLMSDCISNDGEYYTYFHDAEKEVFTGFLDDIADWELEIIYSYNMAGKILASGNGTEESPYLIYNETELAYFVRLVNYGANAFVYFTDDENVTAVDLGNYENTYGIKLGSMTGKTFRLGYFKLMNDIDLSGVQWSVPIIDFIGTFDGNSFEIQNLTSISEDTAVNDAHSLFHYQNQITTENIAFKNISLTNVKMFVPYCNLSSTLKDESGSALVTHNGEWGGIYTFENCNVSGYYVDLSQITSFSSKTGCTGGIVDIVCNYNNTSGYQTKFVNCINNMHIVAGNQSQVGGIVGYTYKSTDNKAVSFINCINNGYINDLDVAEAYWNVYEDGIYADFDTYFANSSENGAKVWTVGNSIAGIVGYCSNYEVSFISCANNGDILGGSYTAGICGRTERMARFLDCDNTADIICYNNDIYYSYNGSWYRYSYIGGMAGYTGYGSYFYNCNNSGSVTNGGAGSSAGYVGGIVGYFVGASDDKSSALYDLGTGITLEDLQNGTVDLDAIKQNIDDDTFGTLSTNTQNYTNKGFYNCAVKGDEEPIEIVGWNYVGSLAGLAYYANIVGFENNEHVTVMSKIMRNSRGQNIGTTGYVGGIVGYVGNSYAYRTEGEKMVYSNLTNYANVKVSDESIYATYYYFGGFFGIATGYITIENCSNEMNMNFVNTNNVITIYVGGFIGSAGAGVNVINCINNGTIETVGMAGDSTGQADVGGIVGRYHRGDVAVNASGNAVESGSILNCVNNKAITSTGSCIGGIVGSVNGGALSVEDCTNNAVISGAYRVGGIVGAGEWLASEVASFKPLIITNSVNNEDADIIGTSHVGGILGRAASSSSATMTSSISYVCKENTQIKNCSNFSDVIATSSIRLGGIAGYVDYATIENCKVENIDIKANGKTSYSVGGIVGETYYSTIKNCKAKDVKIEKVHSSSETNGHTGGIVGWITYVEISNCSVEGFDYTAIKPLDNSPVGQINYTGGLVGYSNNSNITNCSVKDFEMSYDEGITTKDDNVGGFVGRVEAKIDTYNSIYNRIGYDATEYGDTAQEFAINNCSVNNAKIIGRSYVGGFAGVARTIAINDCSVIKAEVIAYGSNFGGFIGCMENEYNALSNDRLVHFNKVGVEIKNCSVDEQSTVTKTSPNDGDACGGFVGYMFAGTIENSYTYADVNVNATQFVGGFAGKCGYDWQLEFQTNTTLKNCYNENTITVTEGIAKSYYGGFVGYVTAGQDTNFDNCYAKCNLNGVYKDVGGFAGYIELINFYWGDYDYENAVYNVVSEDSIDKYTCKNWTSSIDFTNSYAHTNVAFASTAEKEHCGLFAGYVGFGQKTYTTTMGDTRYKNSYGYLREYVENNEVIDLNISGCYVSTELKGISTAYFINTICYDVYNANYYNANYYTSYGYTAWTADQYEHCNITLSNNFVARNGGTDVSTIPFEKVKSSSTIIDYSQVAMPSVEDEKYVLTRVKDTITHPQYISANGIKIYSSDAFKASLGDVLDETNGKLWTIPTESSITLNGKEVVYMENNRFVLDGTAYLIQNNKLYATYLGKPVATIGNNKFTLNGKTYEIDENAIRFKGAITQVDNLNEFVIDGSTYILDKENNMIKRISSSTETWQIYGVNNNNNGFKLIKGKNFENILIDSTNNNAVWVMRDLLLNTQTSLGTRNNGESRAHYEIFELNGKTYYLIGELRNNQATSALYHGIYEQSANIVSNEFTLIIDSIEYSFVVSDNGVTVTGGSYNNETINFANNTSSVWEDYELGQLYSNAKHFEFMGNLYKISATATYPEPANVVMKYVDRAGLLSSNTNEQIFTIDGKTYMFTALTQTETSRHHVNYHGIHELHEMVSCGSVMAVQNAGSLYTFIVDGVEYYCNGNTFAYNEQGVNVYYKVSDIVSNIFTINGVNYRYEGMNVYLVDSKVAEISVNGDGYKVFTLDDSIYRVIYTNENDATSLYVLKQYITDIDYDTENKVNTFTLRVAENNVIYSIKGINAGLPYFRNIETMKVTYYDTFDSDNILRLFDKDVFRGGRTYSTGSLTTGLSDIQHTYLKVFQALTAGEDVSEIIDNKFTINGTIYSIDNDTNTISEFVEIDENGRFTIDGIEYILYGNKVLSSNSIATISDGVFTIGQRTYFVDSENIRSYNVVIKAKSTGKVTINGVTYIVVDTDNDVVGDITTHEAEITGAINNYNGAIDNYNSQVAEIQAKLPDGYTALEYITGANAVIDTGIVNNSNDLSFTGKFMATSYGQYALIFGSYINESTNCTRVIFNSGDNGTVVAYYTNKASGGGTSVPCIKNNIHTITLQSTGYVVDGALYTKGTTTGNTDTATMKLVGTYARIYGFEVKQGGVTIMELIPAKNSSDVIGMYDTKSGTFFTSSGSGVFTAGTYESNAYNTNTGTYATGSQGTYDYDLPAGVIATVTYADLPEGYTVLEYVQSTGIQYIDTGYTQAYSSKIRYEFDYMPTTLSGYFGGNGITQCAITSNNGFAINTRSQCVVEHTANGTTTITTDGNVKATANYGAGYNGCKIAIFNMGISTGIGTYYASGYLYSYKLFIDNDDDPVRNMIPAKNSSNVVGMYDLVSGTFFTNDGNGLFRYSLPMNEEGYTALEYIQSNGYQLIDTGYALTTNNFKFETKFMWTGLSGEQDFLSNYYGGSGEQNRLAIGANGTNFYFWNNGSSYTPYAISNNVAYIIVGNANDTTRWGTINGNAFSITYSARDVKSSNNFKMFGLGNESGGKVSGKMYYMKIYDNGTLVRDFVPCQRKSDGANGMYDKVNGVFYASKTSTNFIAGPTEGWVVDGYTPVDYIETSGTQWIDTGYNIKSVNSGYEVSVETNYVYPGYNNYYISDGVSASGGNGLVLNSNYGLGQVIAESGSYSFYNKNTRTILAGKQYTISNDFIDSDGDGFYDTARIFADGVLAVSTKNNGAVNAVSGSTETVKLFRSVANTNGAYMFYGKMYYAKIFDDINNDGTKELVAYMVPVKRNSDGLVGMYDVIRNQFYTNSGSGLFTTAQDETMSDYFKSGSDVRIPEAYRDRYKQVEYIQSTGSQWINTEYYPNNDTRVVMDLQWNGGNFGIFGASTSGWTTGSFGFYNGITNVYSSYNSNGCSFGDFSNYVGVRMTIDKNKNKVYFNNQLVCTNSDGTFTSENPMYISTFNYGESTVQNTAQMKIYSCKIYGDGDDETSLVRNHVPCFDAQTGKLGLFDLVENKFYGSITATNFVMPEIVVSATNNVFTSIDGTQYINANGTYRDYAILDTLENGVEFTIDSNDYIIDNGNIIANNALYTLNGDDEFTIGDMTYKYDSTKNRFVNITTSTIVADDMFIMNGQLYYIRETTQDDNPVVVAIAMEKVTTVSSNVFTISEGANAGTYTINSGKVYEGTTIFDNTTLVDDIVNGTFMIDDVVYRIYNDEVWTNILPKTLSTIDNNYARELDYYMVYGDAIEYKIQLINENGVGINVDNLTYITNDLPNDSWAQAGETKISETTITYGQYRDAKITIAPEIDERKFCYWQIEIDNVRYFTKINNTLDLLNDFLLGKYEDGSGDDGVSILKYIVEDTGTPTITVRAVFGLGYQYVQFSCNEYGELIVNLSDFGEADGVEDLGNGEYKIDRNKFKDSEKASDITNEGCITINTNTYKIEENELYYYYNNNQSSMISYIINNFFTIGVDTYYIKGNEVYKMLEDRTITVQATAYDYIHIGSIQLNGKSKLAENETSLTTKTITFKLADLIETTMPTTVETSTFYDVNENVFVIGEGDDAIIYTINDERTKVTGSNSAQYYSIIDSQFSMNNKVYKLEINESGDITSVIETTSYAVSTNNAGSTFVIGEGDAAKTYTLNFVSGMITSVSADGFLTDVYDSTFLIGDDMYVINYKDIIRNTFNVSFARDSISIEVSQEVKFGDVILNQATDNRAQQNLIPVAGRNITRQLNDTIFTTETTFEADTNQMRYEFVGWELRNGSTVREISDLTTVENKIKELTLNTEFLDLYYDGQNELRFVAVYQYRQKVDIGLATGANEYGNMTITVKYGDGTEVDYSETIGYFVVGTQIVMVSNPDDYCSFDKYTFTRKDASDMITTVTSAINPYTYKVGNSYNDVEIASSMERTQYVLDVKVKTLSNSDISVDSLLVSTSNEYSTDTEYFLAIGDVISEINVNGDNYIDEYEFVGWYILDKNGNRGEVNNEIRDVFADAQWLKEHIISGNTISIEAVFKEQFTVSILVQDKYKGSSPRFTVTTANGTELTYDEEKRMLIFDSSLEDKNKYVVTYGSELHIKVNKPDTLNFVEFKGLLSNNLGINETELTEIDETNDIYEAIIFVNSTRNLIIEFAAKPLNFESKTDTSGAVGNVENGTKNIELNDMIVIKFNANTGYEMTSWTINGMSVEQFANKINAEVEAGEDEVIALYTEDTNTLTIMVTENYLNWFNENYDSEFNSKFVTTINSMYLMIIVGIATLIPLAIIVMFIMIIIKNKKKKALADLALVAQNQERRLDTDLVKHAKGE